MAVIYFVAVVFLLTLFMQGQMLTNPSAEVVTSLETMGHSGSTNAALFGNLKISNNTAFTLFIGITLLFGTGFTLLRSRNEDY